jgi:hypothetical protein
MKVWPYSIATCRPADVKRHCVLNAEWQKFRESLKGLPTEVKLDRLNEWYHKKIKLQGSEGRLAIYAVSIQVSNYINALKRGGQLDHMGRVIK